MHLRAGKALHEIASEMNVSFQTIVRYMKLQVAEGGVTASEVFFGIEQGRRDFLKNALEKSNGHPDKNYYRLASSRDIAWDEANLFWSLSSSTANRGDMYERVADLEVGLHQHIKEVLSREYGEQESDWWRAGVPLSVRKACVQAREEDTEPVESAFAYTTFIHLSEIIDKNWKLFSENLPKSFISHKQTFLSNLKKLNSIRNAVMHPVKGKSWDEDDFVFVGTLLSELAAHVHPKSQKSPLIRRTVPFGALR